MRTKLACHQNVDQNLQSNYFSKIRNNTTICIHTVTLCWNQFQSWNKSRFVHVVWDFDWYAEKKPSFNVNSTHHETNCTLFEWESSKRVKKKLKKTNGKENVEFKCGELIECHIRCLTFQRRCDFAAVLEHRPQQVVTCKHRVFQSKWNHLLFMLYEAT